jgi:hypothetical protein
VYINCINSAQTSTHYLTDYDITFNIIIYQHIFVELRSTNTPQIRDTVSVRHRHDTYDYIELYYFLTIWSVLTCQYPCCIQCSCFIAQSKLGHTLDCTKLQIIQRNQNIRIVDPIKVTIWYDTNCNKLLALTIIFKEWN